MCYSCIFISLIALNEIGYLIPKSLFRVSLYAYLNEVYILQSWSIRVITDEISIGLLEICWEKKVLCGDYSFIYHWYK